MSSFMPYVGKPFMVHCDGPLLYTVRTCDCKSVADVKALWRLSFRSFWLDSRDRVMRSPEPSFRRLRREGFDMQSSPADYAERLALVHRQHAAASTVVAIKIDMLRERRHIRQAFRLIEKYSYAGGLKYLEQAFRAVRKAEDDGLVVDDYALTVDQFMSDIVNRRY